MRAREEAILAALGIWRRSLWNERPQARPGAQAQQEGVDGGEFQAFFIALQSVEAQLVMHQVKVEAVIALRGGVQLGLDIVGVKPYHEIRHKKPPFKALNFCSVQENNNTKKMRC